MRALILGALLTLTAGCQWCVDQVCVVPKAPNAPEKPGRRDTTHCDLLPGSVYIAPNGDRLVFGGDDVEFRTGSGTDLYDYRCHKGWIQFRDGGLASDALLKPYGELEWLGVVYRLEKAR